MNEFHPMLEKATSSVLSIISINLWLTLSDCRDIEIRKIEFVAK